MLPWPFGAVWLLPDEAGEESSSLGRLKALKMFHSALKTATSADLPALVSNACVSVGPRSVSSDGVGTCCHASETWL